MKAYLISLGCPKNLTDTEVLMGKLVASGYEITRKPSQADLIIINTCAFLKSARQESLATIKGMAKWRRKGKKLYLAGCLPKYLQNHKLGIRHLALGIDGLIQSLGLFDYHTPRIKATQPWTAYVKIAEGCNNHCAYCLIPKIRGKLKLRKVNDIVQEAQQLADRGVKEIILIAQDTTAHPKLADILRKIARIKGLNWVRLMYAYPAHLTDKVIRTIAAEKKIVKYLDLPIQHASDKILQTMNRPALSGRGLEKLIFKIRRRIPGIALRTSVIVGFPGEGEAEFQELLSFIRKVKFPRLGVFTYSREDGTPASKLGGQVSARVKKLRFHQLMRAQAGVARELNKKLVGQTLEILVEGANWGRSFRDAPEIDGKVHIKTTKSLSPGEFVRARIVSAGAYDLTGVLT